MEPGELLGGDGGSGILPLSVLGRKRRDAAATLGLGSERQDAAATVNCLVGRDAHEFRFLLFEGAVGLESFVAGLAESSASI